MYTKLYLCYSHLLGALEACTIVIFIHSGVTKADRLRSQKRVRSKFKGSFVLMLDVCI